MMCIRQARRNEVKWPQNLPIETQIALNNAAQFGYTYADEQFKEESIDGTFQIHEFSGKQKFPSNEEYREWVRLYCYEDFCADRITLIEEVLKITTNPTEVASFKEYIKTLEAEIKKPSVTMRYLEDLVKRRLGEGSHYFSNLK